MASMWFDSKAARVGLASVSAFFGFLLSVVYVADLFGGGLVGYASSVILAVVVFFIVYFTVPRSEKPARPVTPAQPPSTSPNVTTIVNTPVNVNVVSPAQAWQPGATPPGTSTPEPQQAPTDTKPQARPKPRGSPAPPADESPYMEERFPDPVEVRPGREGAWTHELDIRVGETLEVNLREVNLDAFRWMIMSEDNLNAFLNHEDFYPQKGNGDARAETIRWKCKRQDRWYLVLDAEGKHYSRKVTVSLRKYATR